MTNEQYRLNEVERIISDCEIACAGEIGDAYGRERAKDNNSLCNTYIQGKLAAYSNVLKDLEELSDG